MTARRNVRALRSEIASQKARIRELEEAVNCSICRSNHDAHKVLLEGP